MSKRTTTPLTFFGEYDSPNAENNEAVYRARLELMRKVKNTCPEFLRELAQKVLPAYQSLVREGHAFDEILAAKSPFGSLPRVGGLKASLQAWAEAFNAKEAWLLDQALHTLHEWDIAPDHLESLTWSTFKRHDGVFVVGDPFEFRHDAWEATLLPWSRYRTSLQRKFEEYLFAYEQRTRKLAESKGLVRAPRQYSPANLDWFILFQFGGKSPLEIANSLALTNTKALSEETIRKGIKTAAKLVAWSRLRGNKPTLQKTR